MEAVDAIDSLCRKRAKCHECSSIDSYYQCSDQGHDTYGVKVIMSSGALSCAANTDQCSRNACECDRHFVNQIVSLLSYEPESFGSFGYRTGFNPLTSCSKSIVSLYRGNPPRSDQCCGTSLTARYPFFTEGGDKGCCNANTYDTNTFDCCNDGRLVRKGTRCIYNITA